MSLDPERVPVVYPVFDWLEITARLEVLGDGALAAAITAAMSGRRLGDEALFDLTNDERERVRVVVDTHSAEEVLASRTEDAASARETRTCGARADHPLRRGRLEALPKPAPMWGGRTCR